MYYSNLNVPIKGISSNQNTSRLLSSLSISDNKNQSSHGNPKIFINDRHP